MSDVYVNTSVSVVWNDIAANTNLFVNRNVFVEVSHNGIKVALVVFYHNFSDKLILIGYSKVDMDLPNGTYIAHRKVTPLIDGGNNFLFFTAHYRYFIMAANDFSKHRIGKKYIHDEYQIILMKSVKALIYAPFREPTFQ